MNDHEDNSYPGLVPKDDLTMSSLEIAKLINRDHASVMRIVQRTLEVMRIDPAPFLHVHTGGEGGAIAIFRLPRRECELVIDIGASFTEDQDEAIWRRWDEMETPHNERLKANLREYSRKLRSAQEATPPLEPARQMAREDGRQRAIFGFKEITENAAVPPATAVVVPFDPSNVPDVFTPSPADGQVKTMSSLEIAELCGKEHRNVMRDIRAVLEEAGIDALRFERIYLDARNRKKPCYHLPRFECDLVVSGYSVKYRAAIIKRWHELEAKEAAAPVQPALPQTYPEALRALADAAEQNEQQAQQLQLQTRELAVKDEQLEVAAPKVEFYDDLMDADGLYGVNAAAKLLRISLGGKTPLGEKGLFKLLRDDGVLTKSAANWNDPAQWTLPPRGYFRIVTGTREGRIINHATGERRTVATKTTKVTPKGLAWLKKRYAHLRLLQ